MQEIIVTSQDEWDKLKDGYKDETVIKIQTDASFWLVIKKIPDNSSAELWESSSAVLWGSSSAELWESSRAVLRESSSAVLRESSSAVLRESSRAELWGSSSAVLWGSSSAELWGSSSAVLWGSSSAELWGSSSAVLRESSRAELWGSSRAELWGSSTGHVQSDSVILTLWAFAVAFAHVKSKISKKSKTCTVVTPKTKPGLEGWLENEGIESKASVILFKRVSKDLKTQEGTSNETLWGIGLTLEMKDWEPKKEECGKGKFHACSRGYFCDEFRSDHADDRYIAISVLKSDLYAWPNPQYPHKIAFRKGKVLYECNKWGEKV